MANFTLPKDPMPNVTPKVNCFTDTGVGRERDGRGGDVGVEGAVGVGVVVIVMLNDECRYAC